MRPSRISGLMMAVALSGCADRDWPESVPASAPERAAAIAPAAEVVKDDAPADETRHDPIGQQRAEADVVAQLDRAWHDLRGERPLGQLVSDMNKAFDFNIELDTEPLLQKGITPDVRVSVATEPETYGDAVGTMLTAIGAEPAFRDGGLLITTRERAGDMLTTRSYDVSNADSSSLDELTVQIEVAAGEAYWQPIDGIGGSQRLQPATGELTIQQTFLVQERIRRFLEKKLGGPLPFTAGGI